MEEFTANGQEVASLADYQDGSVVSKVILKEEKGSVTFFAFDLGQGLSEHTAPFDALVHVVEGAVEVSIAGVSHKLGAGEMIVMPAHQPHALQAVSRFKMLLTMIKA